MKVDEDSGCSCLHGRENDDEARTQQASERSGPLGANPGAQDGPRLTLPAILPTLNIATTLTTCISDSFVYSLRHDKCQGYLFGDLYWHLPGIHDFEVSVSTKAGLYTTKPLAKKHSKGRCFTTVEIVHLDCRVPNVRCDSVRNLRPVAATPAQKPKRIVSAATSSGRQPSVNLE
nr:hypothetical protein CFP56_22263 [Quercus suber]